jgi:NOL1/NOP2/fmu family ribosome biogenesis protein
MKNFFDTFCDYLPFIVLALFLVILVGGLLVSTVVEISKTEVETYITGCDVTQVVYAEKVSGRTSKPSYKMGICNDEICATVDITAEQFAMFSVGDTVRVQVTIYEKLDGTQEISYKILGFEG